MTKRRKKMPRVDPDNHEVMVAKKKDKIKKMIPVRVDPKTIIFVDRGADKKKAVAEFIQKLEYHREQAWKRQTV